MAAERVAPLLLLCFTLAIPATVALAEDATPTDTIARFSYEAGRGLRFGDTGLVMGGFTTAEFDALRHESAVGSLETVGLLFFFDPVPYIHLFSEIEAGPILEVGGDQHGVHVDPIVDVDRLFVDLGSSDEIKLRFGQFRTPFGRWNVAPIEPLVWTTSEPLLVGEVFDELSVGAMLHGSLFPSGGALSYSVYGTFLDDISSDPEAPVRHAAGAHLEYATRSNLTLGASYFGSHTEDHGWNNLGGADFLWQPHERIEISGELLGGRGSRQQGNVWGVYVQPVVETFRTVYLVTRYEHFDSSELPTIDLFDVGVAWVPRPWLRLKADYQFAWPSEDPAEPGLHMSLSFLF